MFYPIWGGPIAWGLSAWAGVVVGLAGVPMYPTHFQVEAERLPD